MLKKARDSPLLAPSHFGGGILDDDDDAVDVDDVDGGWGPAYEVAVTVCWANLDGGVGGGEVVAAAGTGGGRGAG